MKTHTGDALRSYLCSVLFAPDSDMRVCVGDEARNVCQK
jgi:hypothetical protein